LILSPHRKESNTRVQKVKLGSSLKEQLHKDLRTRSSLGPSPESLGRRGSVVLARGAASKVPSTTSSFHKLGDNGSSSEAFVAGGKETSSSQRQLDVVQEEVAIKARTSLLKQQTEGICRSVNAVNEIELRKNSLEKEKPSHVPGYLLKTDAGEKMEVALELSEEDALRADILRRASQYPDIFPPDIFRQVNQSSEFLSWKVEDFLERADARSELREGLKNFIDPPPPPPMEVPIYPPEAVYFSKNQILFYTKEIIDHLPAKKLPPRSEHTPGLTAIYAAKAQLEQLESHNKAAEKDSMLEEGEKVAQRTSQKTKNITTELVNHQKEIMHFVDAAARNRGGLPTPSVQSAASVSEVVARRAASAPHRSQKKAPDELRSDRPRSSKPRPLTAQDRERNQAVIQLHLTNYSRTAQVRNGIEDRKVQGKRLSLLKERCQSASSFAQSVHRHPAHLGLVRKKNKDGNQLPRGSTSERSSRKMDILDENEEEERLVTETKESQEKWENRVLESDKAILQSHKFNVANVKLKLDAWTAEIDNRVADEMQRKILRSTLASSQSMRQNTVSEMARRNSLLKMESMKPLRQNTAPEFMEKNDRKESQSDANEKERDVRSPVNENRSPSPSSTKAELITLLTCSFTEPPELPIDENENKNRPSSSSTYSRDLTDSRQDSRRKIRSAFRELGEIERQKERLQPPQPVVKQSLPQQAAGNSHPSNFLRPLTAPDYSNGRSSASTSSYSIAGDSDTMIEEEEEEEDAARVHALANRPPPSLTLRQQSFIATRKMMGSLFGGISQDELLYSEDAVEVKYSAVPSVRQQQIGKQQLERERQALVARKELQGKRRRMKEEHRQALDKIQKDMYKNMNFVDTFKQDMHSNYVNLQARRSERDHSRLSSA